MDQDHRITLFTGTYGSGKSETAVSYSHHLLDLGYSVKILDLDVVNPYFRCREAREDLEKRVRFTADDPRCGWPGVSQPYLFKHWCRYGSRAYP